VNQSTQWISEALESIGESKKFNAWMISQFASELKRKKLWEIGAGTGNISEFFLDFEELLLTEYEPIFLDQLKAKFTLPHVGIDFADLTKLSTESYRSKQFDDIICINVLEHIENDELALKNISEVMHEQTKFTLLVPAHPFLYGAMDKQAGHFRRYTRKELHFKLEKAGLEVIKTKYFNRISAFGWFLKGRLLKNPRIKSSDMKMIEFLLPLLKLEKYLPLPFGQSLIAICQLPKSH